MGGGGGTPRALAAALAPALGGGGGAPRAAAAGTAPGRGAGVGGGGAVLPVAAVAAGEPPPREGGGGASLLLLWSKLARPTRSSSAPAGSFLARFFVDTASPAQQMSEMPRGLPRYHRSPNWATRTTPAPRTTMPMVRPPALASFCDPPPPTHTHTQVRTRKVQRDNA